MYFFTCSFLVKETCEELLIQHLLDNISFGSYSLFQRSYN